MVLNLYARVYVRLSVEYPCLSGEHRCFIDLPDNVTLIAREIYVRRLL
jgi:hypothetical protein